MSVFSKFINKKKVGEQEQDKVGGVQDFMTLIRVYYQAVMASSLGITNLNSLPDMAVFKRTLKIPTENNKLGLSEKKRCKKMLIQIYGLSDNFFKEIDSSIRKNCRNVNEVQGYLFMFQGFSNDLMMLVGNLMQWKLRMPSFFRKALYALTEKAVSDILVKNNWKDDSIRKTCMDIRKYQKTLNYSSQWMTEYAYHIIILAKKEKKPQGGV